MKYIKVKILIPVLLVVLVAVGLFVGYKKLWLFTPAYSGRQTLQSFFSDISKGKDQQAYDLTTTAFQKNNSYSAFQTSFNFLNGSNLSIKYSSYSISNSIDTINGSVEQKNSSNIVKFGANMATQSGKVKIDSMAVGNFESQ